MSCWNLPQVAEADDGPTLSDFSVELCAHAVMVVRCASERLAFGDTGLTSGLSPQRLDVVFGGSTLRADVLRQDIVAHCDAGAADVHAGTGDQRLDLIAGLAAERAVQRDRGLLLVVHLVPPLR